MSGKEYKGLFRIQVDGFIESDFSIFNESEDIKNVKIGNVDWKIRVYSRNSEKITNVKHLSVEICCNPESRSNLWSCDASIKLNLMKSNKIPKDTFSMKFDMKFEKNCQKMDIADFMNWEELTYKKNGYVIDNYVVIEAVIVIKNLYGLKEKIIEDFSEEKENLTDVVLVVEGKKVHVGKQILAGSSKFFYALFYSDFSENSQCEVIIEEVVHSEFIDFLNMVYPTHKLIETTNFGHILKLADRFGADMVIGKCEDFLISNSGINVVDKLLYAENYALSELQDNCLQQLTKAEHFSEIKRHEKYENLGGVTCKVILDKMMDIMIK